MRILITGAAGQIGSALKERLQFDGCVIAVDRRALDLSKPKTIAATLNGLAPDLLINAAAYTAVDRAEDEPGLAWSVNAEAPGVMARWAAKGNVPFIHFSTDYVFDGSGHAPWEEDDSPRPLSVYGSSKLAGEEEVRAANGPSLVVRTSWVYAASGTNFLRKIAELARDQVELRVVADQIGAPTPAALIADAIASMVNGGQDALRARVREAGGLVHLCASGEASWHRFATEIVAGMRTRGYALAVERILPVSSAERASRARRPLNSRLDLQRLKSVFGIVPADWRAALRTELDRLGEMTT